MIDHVAEKQLLLTKANAEGSLSNEQTFRDSIAKFQESFREQRPSVVDISTSAERQFSADLTNLKAMAAETQDPQIKRLALVVVRALSYLARTSELRS